VEEKASKMDPNPLKDPSQRQAAVKLFRDTLFEVFSGVLNEHGVTDEQKVRAMLDDIQHQKAVRFAQCMEKKMPKAEAAPTEKKEETQPKGQPTPDLSMADSEPSHEAAPASEGTTEQAPKEPEAKPEHQDQKADKHSDKDSDSDEDDDDDDDDDEDDDSEKSEK
jgi:hypothetical protein